MALLRHSQLRERGRHSIRNRTLAHKQSHMYKPYFEPKELAVLTAVLQRACLDMGVVDNGQREVIASRIIRLAQTGKWDLPEKEPTISDFLHFFEIAAHRIQSEPHRRECIRRKFHKIDRLHAQADRARKIATQCGFGLVADLLETHARICMRNVKAANSSLCTKRAIHARTVPKIRLSRAASGVSLKDTIYHAVDVFSRQ